MPKTMDSILPILSIFGTLGPVFWALWRSRYSLVKVFWAPSNDEFPEGPDRTYGTPPPQLV